MGERQARIDAEGKLRLEDIAKLDPNRWAEQVKKLNTSGMDNAMGEGADMSKSMPQTAWMKHLLPKMKEVAPQMREIRAAVQAEKAKNAAKAAARDGEAEDGDKDDGDE